MYHEVFEESARHCCAFITLRGFWLHVSTITWQSTTRAKQLNLLTSVLLGNRLRACFL